MSPAVKKLAATIAAGLAVSIFIVLFGLSPLAGALAELHEQARSQHALYTRLLAEEASYKTARIDFEKIQPRAGEISGLFPEREEMVANVEALESAAARFGNELSLTITDASDTPAGTKKITETEYAIVPNLSDVEVVPYDIRLQGGFLAVVRFLQTMENQPFFSEIEQIILTGNREDIGSGPTSRSLRTGSVDANIRAAFYAQKQQTLAAPDENLNQNPDEDL